MLWGQSRASGVRDGAIRRKAPATGSLAVSGARLGVPEGPPSQGPGWVLPCIAPASRPGLPRAHWVRDRLASGSQFPLLHKGPRTCCLQLLPPTPGSGGARSHARPRSSETPSQAGPATGGGLAGGRPCPGPFPWDWGSWLVSWPWGPFCDSDFLEKARRVQGAPQHPTPSVQLPPPACPISAPVAACSGLHLLVHSAPTPEGPLCGRHPQPPWSAGPGQQPLPLLPGPARPKQTSSLLHVPVGQRLSVPWALLLSVWLRRGSSLGITM